MNASELLANTLSPGTPPTLRTPKSHTLTLQKDAALRTDAVQKLENASRENFVSTTSNLLSPIHNHLILFFLRKCSLPTC